MMHAKPTSTPSKGAAIIGIHAGEVVSRQKVKKHFECRIGDDSFFPRRRAESVRRKAALDGVQAIRTSLTAEDSARSATRP
ncbi:MAG: hypothetical protein OXN84_12575 [Albidovulum sp.]|nr:hypothetical protein [Albidovulum sp.]